MVRPPVDRTEALELINFSSVLLLQVGLTKWNRVVTWLDDVGDFLERFR